VVPWLPEVAMWLVIKRSGGVGPLALPLAEGETIVGRDGGCAVVLAESDVSGRHLQLTRLGRSVTFRDLDSSSGTRLNGTACDGAVLQPGDTLTVGATTVELSDRPPQASDTTATPVAAAPVDWQPFKAFVERLRRVTDPKELLERLLLGLVEFLSMERGFVLLAERAGAPPVAVASHRLADAEEFISISSTVYGRAIETNEPVYVLDTLRDDWYLQASNQSLVDSPRSIACGPLAAGGTIFGVLYVDGARGEASLDDNHRALFETMTGLAAELLAAARTRSSLLAARGRISALSTMTWGDDERFVLGDGAAARELDELIRAAAAQDVTVLVTGETGTGKEMVARALHRLSPRREGPFVAVNCAALPHDMVEAELFGAEKGAYTGSTERRIGRFEVAASGTLFLDEIGDLPLDVQVKLLRVLQERTVTRLGGTHPLNVDFRLVCATNADLEGAVAGGAFRQDLYYRVNVFRILLKPLRERVEDIVPLAEHFLQTFAARFARPVKGFSDEAVRLIRAYPWPGNIRELKNAVERAVVVEKSAEVLPSSLPVFVGHRAPTPVGGLSLADSLPRDYEVAREMFERAFLLRSLEENGGNVTAVARETGMTRPAVYRRLQKLGITPKE